MAGPAVEYHIQALPDEPSSQQSPRMNLINQWMPFLARAARASFLLYALSRLLFLVVADSNGWMWAFFTWNVQLPGHNMAIAVQKYGDPNLARHRERLRLTKDNSDKDLPLVDILVPCCGESLDVIFDTLNGACQVDYPIERFRILVLDDGRSTALHDMVKELRQTWSNIQYHCRSNAKPDRQVFNKAGNLNYAIFELQEVMEHEHLPEFIAVLDADAIPSPSFLRATLPHLLSFPKLALVGAPQDFYNLPVGDPLVQSLDHWQNIMTPELNQLGSTFHGHSGCVVRRSVLLQHGGFPTITSNEDMLLSSIILGTGWQIISLREMLQLGRVPESLYGHISQRTRWGIALSQLVKALKLSADNTIPPALRWPVTYQGIMILFALLNRVVANIVVPLALISGQSLVPASSPFQLKVQVALAVLSLGLAWLFEWLQTARFGFRGAPFGDLEELWMAPGYIWAIFGFWCLPSRSRGSVVTGNTLNPWNSSTTDGRFSQLKRDLWDAGAFINLLSFVGTLSAMLYTATYVQHREGLLVSVAWPPMLNLCYLLITSNWIPLVCIISPPSWTNPMTSAMKPGAMDSRVMFTRLELQLPLRTPRRPLGYADHYALVPPVLLALLYATLWI